MDKIKLYPYQKTAVADIMKQVEAGRKYWDKTHPEYEPRVQPPDYLTPLPSRGYGKTAVMKALAKELSEFAKKHNITFVRPKAPPQRRDPLLDRVIDEVDGPWLFVDEVPNSHVAIRQLKPRSP